MRIEGRTDRHEIWIDAGSAGLAGTLIVPEGVMAVVVLPHLAGPERRSHRSRRLAAALRARHLATCAIELLTDDLLLAAARLIAVTDWLATRPRIRALPLGYLAAETSAAALVAAAARPETVRAVVSWGGRPDLAVATLPRVAAATLLLAPERDPVALERNRHAIAALLAPGWVESVPGAAALGGDDARVDDVARRATDWFVHHAVDERRYQNAS